MIVVIQCAGRKRRSARRLMSATGKPVIFVANPNAAPPNASVEYARPDDIADGGMTWRDVLIAYNRNTHENPQGLCRAYELYDNPTYERLVRRFGAKNVYILSAGWGLIRSDFLTPYYDITFSYIKKKKERRYKRRLKTDRYADFRMLSAPADEQVLFFGGKDYLLLFCALTSGTKAKRTVFFNSSRTPSAPGCVLQRYKTSKRTNWHYECANAFLDGAIKLT